MRGHDSLVIMIANSWLTFVASRVRVMVPLKIRRVQGLAYFKSVVTPSRWRGAEISKVVLQYGYSLRPLNVVLNYELRRSNGKEKIRTSVEKVVLFGRLKGRLAENRLTHAAQAASAPFYKTALLRGSMRPSGEGRGIDNTFFFEKERLVKQSNLGKFRRLGVVAIEMYESRYNPNSIHLR
ncbi:hypothetical protein TNCV_1911011 [Trichonephila clavipes]|nr:hypothetical protein TNCV_1911011 [Trichonephila clavipes]